MKNFNELFVSVLLPIPSSRLYTYKAGAVVGIGDFVRVGVGKRKMIGVVWRINEKPDIELEKIRTIIEKLEMPALNLSMLEFIDWVANYTLSFKGMILKMVLPPEKILEKIFEKEKEKTAVQFVSENIKRITPARKKIMQFYEKNKIYEIAELAKQANVSPAIINGLVKQGALTKTTIRQENKMLQEFDETKFKRKKFTTEQQQVANNFNQENFNKKDFLCFLLEGITGSGKTEVYFQAVESCIKASKQVLILLPEIALTDVFVERFYARFATRPQVWHSSTSAGNRKKIWRGVQSGDIKVIAGARSALFLPFNNLGLIIVDEEHDGAYKQEDRVFYNARDMAVARAWLEKIMCILASATPSIESRVNAINNRYHHLRLSKRIHSAELPKIQLIDLRAHPPPKGKFISPILEKAIAKTIKEKKQVLLFLNRRGFAPLMLCRTCGYRFNCRQCAAWLVEHRAKGELRCHHCGLSQSVPQFCPSCQKPDTLVGCGPGVERIGEEIKLLFPKVRVCVLSSDTKGGVEKLKQQLTKIKQGEIDIIIGTQIIAKGHDLPLINCVGVIDADLSIGGDPRSSERTFQLLWQVTGRAGRVDGTSYGFLQTHAPEHPILNSLVSNNFESFYENEIAIRQKAQLPPFAKLVAVLVSGKDLKATQEYARQLKLAAPKNEKVRLLGPAAAPMAFLRGRHRFRLLIHAPRNFEIQKFMKNWQNNFSIKLSKKSSKFASDIRAIIDIDPQSFS